jgi:hypothetical protein
MRFTDSDAHSAPDGALWELITDERLASPECERLRDMVGEFEPLPHEAGREMAGWLQWAVHEGSLPNETHALCTDQEMLGFLAIERGLVKISHRAWPILELRERMRKREPLNALRLSAIVRGASTPPGFGSVLFDHALGLALDDKRVAAILVQPDNDRVDQMWQKHYDFKPMQDSDVSGLLYFPVKPPPAPGEP